MTFSIEKELIYQLLLQQLSNNFLIENNEKLILENFIEVAFKRCEECFKKNINKYYSSDVKGVQEVFFNPYHSVQYMIFIYYLSNTIYKNIPNTKLCDKLYYLNKMLNGVDLFYQIELPTHFGAEHPLGSVIGRAHIDDCFYFYQNCTVGGTIKNNKEVYPNIGYNVTMCSNSSILGNCKIGNNVIIGAGTIVKNQDIPDNSIVFGQSPNIIIKPNISMHSNFKLK